MSRARARVATCQLGAMSGHNCGLLLLQALQDARVAPQQPQQRAHRVARGFVPCRRPRTGSAWRLPCQPPCSKPCQRSCRKPTLALPCHSPHVDPSSAHWRALRSRGDRRCCMRAPAKSCSRTWSLSSSMSTALPCARSQLRTWNPCLSPASSFDALRQALYGPSGSLTKHPTPATAVHKQANAHVSRGAPRGARRHRARESSWSEHMSAAPWRLQHPPPAPCTRMQAGSSQRAPVKTRGQRCVACKHALHSVQPAHTRHTA